ncbi:MAG: DUF2093 domain-containing protein [Sphingobium sp.]|nr:DUF2093 domain-containing protein [Sphingobium sp.]
MQNSLSPALLHYDASDFDILRPGSYVLCAVTGQRIELEDLLYWSAEHQEAYVNAEASVRAYQAGGAAKLREQKS